MLKKALEGKRVYIDTNIYIYVALNHPKYYGKCYEVLDLLISRKFEGYGSILVLFELFGALSEINVNAAYDAALSYLDFPLIILEVDRKTLEYAKIIAEFSKTTYDALHAALVAQNELEVVVTEDLDDWKKILKAWPKLMKKYHVKEIYVFSPARNKVLQI